MIVTIDMADTKTVVDGDTGKVTSSSAELRTFVASEYERFAADFLSPADGHPLRAFAHWMAQVFTDAKITIEEDPIDEGAVDQ